MIRADPAFGPARVAAARFDLDTGLVSLPAGPSRRPRREVRGSSPAGPTPKRGAFPSATGSPAP